MDTTDTIVVTTTDAAADKIAYLLSHEGNDELALRVAVQPGGCSGLRQQIYFDDRALDGDARWTVDASTTSFDMVVDRASAPYLQGATLDFADTIDKQGFTLDIPNAQGTCACGDSFH